MQWLGGTVVRWYGGTGRNKGAEWKGGRVSPGSSVGDANQGEVITKAKHRWNFKDSGTALILSSVK